MAIATEFVLDFAGIAALFRAGARQAEKTEQTILVSFSQLVPEADPLAFFAERQHAGVTAFFWERPSEDFAMAGVGTACKISGKGSQRFEQVQTKWRNLLENVIIKGADEYGVGPLLMGGFSFDPTRPATQLWHSFGDNSLVLPRLQLTRKAGAVYLTVNALLDSESDPETLARQVVHLYRQPAAFSKRSTSNPLKLKDVMPARDWQKLVGEAVERIRQGEFEKVVLAREVKAIAEKPFEAGLILENLRRNFPDATVFAVARENRVFVGATPERLVQLQNGEARTMALAGTIRRGATPAEDKQLGEELLISPKNRVEHAVVVDIIYEALRQSGVEVARPGLPGLLRLKNVQHLYTPLGGSWREPGTILRLVEALHPTPALGGYPRKTSLGFIREKEGLDRGWYGAPLGWLDYRGEGEFVVAIRSALLEGAVATLFAGCGIVADSEPESEYNESCVKLKAMLSALQG